MIYDNLSNIKLYKDLSKDIFQGLAFLRQATLDIENGKYQISSRVKAIVSEYETKMGNEYGYEAHKRFIDIQCVLKGEEKVSYSPIERLKETKPYSKEIDAAFYMEGVRMQSLNLILQPGYFAVFYPQDGHMPQLCVDTPQIVKKVVVKVEII